MLIFALPMLVSACGEVTGNPDSRFVPVESLIDEQIKLLSSLNPRVEKRVRTDKGEGTQVFTHINWQKELAAFRVADISKPGLQGAYTIEAAGPAIRIFRLKENQQAEVRSVKVELGENNRIQSLEAIVEDKNYLYYTKRTFRLTFGKELNGQYVISAYEIAGSQKLIWNPEQPFSLRAKVL